MRCTLRNVSFLSILHLIWFNCFQGLDSSGRLTFGDWTSITNNPADTPFSQPHTQLPVDSFPHIWYTWSPTGTAVYVNGHLEASSSLNYYPALNSTVYLYLNPWGSNVVAAVDELRVSTIARASMFSCAPEAGAAK